MQIKRIPLTSTDSTNNWAKAHFDGCLPGGITVITAEEQTSGRGRFKRTWISPKGVNLYATYVFFLDHLLLELGNIPQVLALTAYETMKPLLPSINLKWPNDLVVGTKKIGGILCEVGQHRDQWGFIAGIGININMKLDQISSIDRPATSLFVELGREFSIEEIEMTLSNTFAKHLKRFLSKGFTSFFKDFEKALIHKPNDHLLYCDFTKQRKGTFQGINEDGSLNLLLEDGTRERCTTGELL